MSAIENKYMMKEPERLVNTLLSLTQIARDDKEPIIWYEEGRNLESEHGDETYRTEVERIIRDKKLRYTFRPIIDLDKCRVIGYQSFAEPLDSFFGSIKELKNYASRTEDDRILFATISRNIIARYAQENSNQSNRLFLQVNNFERHYVNRTFAHIANIKTIHIVLVYDEEELTNLVDDAVTIAEIRNFKSRGYEVALELNDNDLTLTSALYDSFDYFIVDVNANLRIGNKSLQRSLLNFRGLVEKLLKYHRPIIAADIPAWDTVELIDKLGITLISSEVVSPSSENVLPISVKSTMKIKNITK
jgi:EAL domain-containing protein (putative c-di-GMP-specific phosphodiesterase class I)